MSRTILFALFGALALALGACNGDDTSDDDGTTDSGSSDSGSASVLIVSPVRPV